MVTKTEMSASKGSMGLGSCVALIIGACVGSAILSISGVTVFYAGPAAILSWIIAAVIYGAYGVIVAGLARRYPRSGGIYIFPKRAFGGVRGSFWGFVSGWGYIVSNIIAIAFSAIFLGKYLLAGFPGLGPSLAYSIAACLLAAAIILFGGRRSQKIQNALVAMLVATLLIYCGVALFGGGFDISNYSGFFTSGSKGGFGFLNAMPLALVAYGGCVVISFMASEVSEPSRNIPLSLVIGLGAVALIYAAVIACIAGTLPMSVLASDESLRYIPLFASISDGGLAAFPWLSKVVSICGGLALLTTIIALLRVNARAMQVMAREGLLPKFLSRENGRRVPWTSVLLICAVCVVLCFLSRWTEQLITLGAVQNVVCMTVTLVAYIKSRKGSVGRGWRIAVLAGSILLILACYLPDIIRGSWVMMLFTAAVYLIGLVVYFCYRKNVQSRLSGIVVHGKGQGHRHGMPTANLAPYQGEVLPRYGVWATRVMLDNKVYDGLTNVGLRPTDDDSQTPTVETLILDFNSQIYGDEMMLEFVSYIRETLKFQDLDALRAQINEDIKVVRSRLRVPESR